MLFDKKENPVLPVLIVTDVLRKTGIAFELNSKNEKSWIKADELLNKPISQGNLLGNVKKYLK